MSAPQDPSQTPIVSLLVRSMDRPTLYRALGSLALLKGGDIEVVVLNATGAEHSRLADHCGPYPMRLVNPGVAMGRAAAANAALRNAQGRWALFVDDDDTVDPDHVERLRSSLLANPNAVAAYAGVRLLKADGTEAGVLDEPFDLVRLHCENFLPMHAVMFDRAAARSEPWFDESLSVYEDWDFWLRLAQENTFVHVSGVSASYYLMGASGLTHEPDAQVTAQGRALFFAKWGPRMDPLILETLARRAEHLRVKSSQLESECQRLGLAISEQSHKLHEVQAGLDNAHTGLAWQKEQELQARAKWAKAQNLLQDAHAKQHESLAQQMAQQAQWAASLRESQAALTAYGNRLRELQDELLNTRFQAEVDRGHSRTVLDSLRVELAATSEAHSRLLLELEGARSELSGVRAELQQQTKQTVQTEEERNALAAELAQSHQVCNTLQISLAQQTHQTRSVEANLQLAERSYQQLEMGYGQVTQSLSWRMTQPLRRLRSLLSASGEATPARKLVRGVVRRLPVSGPAKQRLKVWMVSRPWAARWLPWLAISTSVAVAPRAPAFPKAANVDAAPAAVAVPVAPASVGKLGLDKEKVRAQAESELTAFLAGPDRLDFTPHAAQLQVSVVVVLYNQAGLSLLCLRSLLQSVDVSFEVLIVDNASSDRVPQLLARLDGATLLPQSENLGFLRAVNLAAAQARGEYLLLLNNDAMVEPQTLQLAVRRLVQEPDVGAVGGAILLWDGSLQEAGSIIWSDGSCLGYGRGDDPASPAYRFVRDVDYCSGALLMVRRALFEQLGRFDGAFAPAYYEESDFCARLWEHGHRVVYDPAVRVKHFEFASDAGSGRALELQAAHRVRFVERHPAFLANRPAPSLQNVLVARQRLAHGKKRLLVIDDRVPLPWLGQGYPRAAHMLKVLVSEGHLVTHYPLQFPHEHPENVARALPSTIEVMVDLGLAGLAAFLTSRQGFYDAVVVSRPHNMQVLTSIMTAQPALLKGVRIVYDAEALFSLRDIAKAQVQGQPMDQAEQQRRIDAEMALAKAASAVVTVSELEASHYRLAGYHDVHVLGHALEVQPTAPAFEARQGFLFVGALLLDDSPNADSLVWLVTQVWPRIQQSLAGTAVLDVVGPCEAPTVQALAGPSVVIHGAVDDLRPFFERTRVFVVPTRYAAGIAHKAHEAAAHGVPMVTSALIAEQLAWQDVVTVGATPAAFAEACVALHTDAKRWGQQREACLQAVARDCSPASFRKVALAAVRSGQ
jgi:GT2 family glycosyltransferase